MRAWRPERATARVAGAATRVSHSRGLLGGRDRDDPTADWLNHSASLLGDARRTTIRGTGSACDDRIRTLGSVKSGRLGIPGCEQNPPLFVRYLASALERIG